MPSGTCKNECKKYKASKPYGGSIYAEGQKRCQICTIFIKWEGLYCPCCGYKLRSKPRNRKFKEKMGEKVQRI
jgi:hypothetical protein